MIFPLPPQRGHALVVWTLPKPGMERTVRTWPLPRQLGQVSGLLPAEAPLPPQSLQFSSRWKVICFLQPLTASIKLSTTWQPTITTGMAHKDPGVGQVGAGIVKAPLDCFVNAAEYYAKHKNG